MGEDWSPVALLWTVVRERVGEEIVPPAAEPAREVSVVEAPPDVVKYFADDRRLGDEPYDAHPLDQFRRDHPLLQEQEKDIGLEEVRRSARSTVRILG